MLSPELKKKQAAAVLELFKSDRSMKLQGAARQLVGSSDDLLPESYVTRVIKDARFQARGSINTEDEMDFLLKYLHDDEDYNFEVLFEQNLLCSDDKFISAISFSDKRLAPVDANSISVLVCDVTFGLTAAASGFNKWSFISNLTPGHEIELVLASGIHHEDQVTFEHQFDLLIKLYPEMEEKHFVLILDGDQANWAAARAKFRNVTLILCIFHSRENFKKRFGRLCRPSKSRSTSETLWIQCEACDKWRQIASEVVLSNSNFKCEDNTDIKFANCSIKEEDTTVDSMGSEIGDYLKSPTELHWHALWDYLRKACSIDEVNKRLREVETIFPQSSSYIKFLTRTQSTWALCVSAWHLTFQFEASSMAEQLHSALKRTLDTQLIALHSMPILLREVLLKRKSNVSVNKSKRPTRELITQANDCGYESLINLMDVYLTIDAKLLLLEQLSKSLEFQVTHLKTADEVNCAMKGSTFRLSSHARFKCLVNLVTTDDSMTSKGLFFKVEKFGSSSDRCDLVYI